jgi:hypothetical protein
MIPPFLYNDLSCIRLIKNTAKYSFMAMMTKRKDHKDIRIAEIQMEFLQESWKNLHELNPFWNHMHGISFCADSFPSAATRLPIDDEVFCFNLYSTTMTSEPGLFIVHSKFLPNIVSCFPKIVSKTPKNIGKLEKETIRLENPFHFQMSTDRSNKSDELWKNSFRWKHNEFYLPNRVVMSSHQTVRDEGKILLNLEKKFATTNSPREV